MENKTFKSAWKDLKKGTFIGNREARDICDKYHHGQSKQSLAKEYKVTVEEIQDILDAD